MTESFNNTLAGYGVSVVDILVPVAILFFGWIFALLVSKGVRKLLMRTTIDERICAMVLGENSSANVDSAKIFSKFVFWIIMLFVIMAFLTRLQLSFAAEPISALLGGVFTFIPKLIGALVLGVVAWIIAKVVRRLVAALLQKTSLDQNFGSEQPAATTRPSTAIAEVAHWLVYLLFLPAILGVLDLRGILAPVETMMNKLLGFLPNLLSAAVIFAVGWFVAKIIQRVVSSALAAVGVDQAAERFGLQSALGNTQLSTLLGYILYIIIIIPVAIAGLDALQLASITAPASIMLSKVMAAIPNVFGAVFVLGISYFVAKFVAGLVSRILSSAGFDRILLKLGLASSLPRPGSMSPSKFVGTLILVMIMLFAAIEASNMLGFEVLGALIARLMVRAGEIALGLIIFAIGLYLGEFASKAIQGSELSQSRLLAFCAKIAITALALAMGLGEMNISGSIVPLAFGLTLGAIAVAVALSFGLGGREQAGEMIRDWRAKWRNSKNTPPQGSGGSSSTKLGL